MSFLAEMAELMQATVSAKGASWAAWKVTVSDLLQWIGIWYYMLAFPQSGDRRMYFTQ